MSWVPVAFAALLLLAVLYPFVQPFLTRGRRARNAHGGGIVHWYPNYDEDLQFEPRLDRDIIAIRKRDLATLGYTPAGETVLVPRTFRRRVAGDVHLRLWTSPDRTLRPVWICCWHGVELPAARTGDDGPTHFSRQMLLRIDTGPPATLRPSSPGTPLDRDARPAPIPSLRVGILEPFPPYELPAEEARFVCNEESAPRRNDTGTDPVSTAQPDAGLRGERGTPGTRRARRRPGRTHRPRTHRPRTRRD